MVSESNGHGVRGTVMFCMMDCHSRSLCCSAAAAADPCWGVTVMVSDSNGHGVRATVVCCCWPLVWCVCVTVLESITVWC
jgi:hypothetical protein